MTQILYFLSFLIYFGVSAISVKNPIEDDKLYILIGEETFLVNLIENPVTKELISVLPMKIKLLNEGISSKNMSLTFKIDTTNLISSESPQIKASH